MKYYLDCEFDGHNGPLLSMALIPIEGLNFYAETLEVPKDEWVKENVFPLMSKHNADVCVLVSSNEVGREIRNYIGEKEVTIVADSPVDIARFCQAVATSPDGGYCPHPDFSMSFEVHDVDCYPTTLRNAVQHNAWWDAMALKEKLNAA